MLPLPSSAHRVLPRGFVQSKAMNEVDAGRDRATPESVRHDDVEPLTPISPCY
jgi:hypothetical protein